MVVKLPLLPIFDQGSISGLCPYITLWHQTFLRQPERIWHRKKNESKRVGKNDRKRERKKFGTAIAKDKLSPNFGLCACIKIHSTILCLTLRKSSSKKNCFFSKTEASLEYRQGGPKTDLTVKSGIFFGDSLVLKGLVVLFKIFSLLTLLYLIFGKSTFC